MVQDTTNDDLRGQGAFVSYSGNPAGPWKRIADVGQARGFGFRSRGLEELATTRASRRDYNQNIVADPKDRRHVYLQLEEVFESTDAGATWKTVGPYWNYDISCDADDQHPYSCPPTTHPDQHAGMIFRGQFWTGNDGGVWRRPLAWHDRGQWTNLNAKLHTTQNYSIAVGKVGHELAYWGGLQDNGESYTRKSMPLVEQAFTGDGGDTIVDPKNGNRAVEEYVDLDMYLTTDGAVTTLKEISPSCLTATDPPALCDPNPRFIAPIEMDVNNPDHWVAGGQYVWDDTKSWATVCSGKEGCDWKAVYNTGDGHQVTALAANGRTTYAAWCGGCNPPTFNRGMATNYGGSWHELALPNIPNRYITSIAVDPGNAAHVYISVGSYSRRWIPDAGVGHVFESTNGGTSWTDVTGNLPDAPVFKVVLRGHDLVVGTEVGAFIVQAAGRITAAVVAARQGPAQRHGVGPGRDAQRQHRGGHARPRGLEDHAEVARPSDLWRVRRPSEPHERRLTLHKSEVGRGQDSGVVRVVGVRRAVRRRPARRGPPIRATCPRGTRRRRSRRGGHPSPHSGRGRSPS